MCRTRWSVVSPACSVPAHVPSSDCAWPVEREFVAETCARKLRPGVASRLSVSAPKRNRATFRRWLPFLQIVDAAADRVGRAIHEELLAGRPRESSPQQKRAPKRAAKTQSGSVQNHTRKLLFGVKIRVDWRVALPLFGQILQCENCRYRAYRHACATINALRRVDKKLLHALDRKSTRLNSS